VDRREVFELRDWLPCQLVISADFLRQGRVVSRTVKLQFIRSRSQRASSRRKAVQLARPRLLSLLALPLFLLLFSYYYFSRVVNLGLFLHVPTRCLGACLCIRSNAGLTDGRLGFVTLDV